MTLLPPAGARSVTQSISTKKVKVKHEAQAKHGKLDVGTSKNSSKREQQQKGRIKPHCIIQQFGKLESDTKRNQN